MKADGYVETTLGRVSLSPACILTISPLFRSARPETRSRVTSDCISSQLAHISADSPGESGVDSRKVSANRNRCNS